MGSPSSSARSVDRLRERVRRIPRIDRLARRAAAAAGRFLRFELNLHVLLRLPWFAYERIPDVFKDGRAMWVRRFRSRGRFFFVQIGSNDGVRRDPIHDLAMRHHWSGIRVEPVPSLFSALVQNCSGNPNLRFENAAIAEERGSLPFYSLRATARALPAWHDLIGSLLPETLRKYRREIPDIEEHVVEDVVRAMTYDDLMEKYGEPPVDLLHIDTEGYDLRILRSIDLERRRLPMIMYEKVVMSEEEREQCTALLRSAGYALVDHGPDAFAYLRDRGDVRDGGLR